MNPAARRIQRTYLVLLLGNTLAASFIWGINTLFLLDAGLSNLEAFAANAFFTAGMVVFEVPTGIVADTWGRRASYLLGTITLAGSTFLYWLLWVTSAPFWQWAIVSMLVGMFGLASRLMHDLGFEPQPMRQPVRAMRTVLVASLEHGLKNPPVRWIMLAAPFSAGVGIYTFYALQPFLLELWGDRDAYAAPASRPRWVAGSQ